MSDVDDFFAEQDDRMNIPDENLEDYVARMAVVMNRDIRLPQATRETHAPEREAEDQARGSSSKKCKVDSRSNSTTPECLSHEGTSVLKRRQNQHNSTDTPVTKKHKQNQVHTAANSNAAGEQTTFRSINIAHNTDSPTSEARPGLRIRSKQPTSAAKRSTDDHEYPSSSASVECATSARNSTPAPAMYSSNQGLRHSQLDAAPVPSAGASKPPFSPSIMNDQMGHQSNPKLHEPRTDLPHRRSKSKAAPQASSISTQELLSRPTYKTPYHTDGNEHRQPISATPVNVSPASNTSAIQPLLASSIAPLTLNPSRVTSSSHSEAPTTKHMRDNVDSSPIKSHSISKSGRPAQGPSNATPISEFLPQATSTQLPATPAGPGSIQNKVANFSRSKVTSKRDRVLKLTPRHKAEADISNITTPNATEVLISAVPDDVSSSVLPRAGASNTKPAMAKDKKLAISKGKKKPKELVTPLAYARILCNKLDVLAKKTDFLKGKRLFYTGGDMQYASQSTKKKMELIIQNGGVLLPNYDPKHVTHIITDAAERPTLRALGLKSLKDVAPHTPIVTWSWVTEGRGRAGLTEMEHAAFPSHIVDTVGRAKVENESSGELSRISQFTQDDPHAAPSAHLSMASVSRPSSPQDNLRSLKFSTEQAASTSYSAQLSEPRDSNDPLAEFYELAKAERDNAVSEYEDDIIGDHDKSEDGETDDEYHGEAGPPAKRGFTCDSKVNRSEGSKNQDIIEKLQELMELHKSKPSKDDFWRGFSYSKAIGPIRNHPRRIRSYAEARSIRGVGDKTAEKIMEIIQTGGLRRIAFENTRDVEAAKIFTGIYGVGQTIAYTWYARGCRTLDDVRARKGGVKLTPAMEIGLRFYDDINSRMPRDEAEELFKLVKPIALDLDPRLFIEIMGSFRRGKKDCGDIDIMITRPIDDNKTHAGIVPHLLHALREAGIITEDLALPDDSHATEAIYRGLCRLPDTVDDEGKVVRRLRRRIDILSIPWQNRGAALLYYTGDDIFNRAMRFKANKMGYSLNQRGLFQGVVRDPHDRRVKTNAGNIIASETEEEIFKILGVPWQEPHERVRSQ